MHDTHEDVLAGLSSTPVVLEQLVKSAGSTGPAEGWNAAEVVWHLWEAEARGLERMRAMRDQQLPFLPAYDPAALARDGRYAERAIEAGVREFTAVRGTMLEELRALRADQWDRSGRHEEVGTITILNQAIHLLGHDLNHLAQLGRLLAPAPVA